MIPINEIFGPTLQGEGPEAGKKCIFVRVTGCDFNCSWCDSKRAWTVDENTRKYEDEELVEELVNRCISSNTNTIILTGGNPCLYDFTNVIEGVEAQIPDITFSVETQGTKFPKWLYMVNTIVISPKGPSSGQKDVFENIKEFLYEVDKSKYPWDLYTKTICLKFVIFNKEDLEFSKKYYNLLDSNNFTTGLNTDLKFYLSVGNDNVNEEGSIAERILNNYHKVIDMVMEDEDLNNVYILPQIHTLVWGNKAGV